MLAELRIPDELAARILKSLVPKSSPSLDGADSEPSMRSDLKVRLDSMEIPMMVFRDKQRPGETVSNEVRIVGLHEAGSQPAAYRQSGTRKNTTLTLCGC